jgi:hypothetical protein
VIVAMLSGEQRAGDEDHLQIEQLAGDDAAVLLDVEDLTQRGAQGADEAGGQPGEDEGTDGEQAGGLLMISFR